MQVAFGRVRRKTSPAKKRERSALAWNPARLQTAKKHPSKNPTGLGTELPNCMRELTSDFPCEMLQFRSDQFFPCKLHSRG